MKPLYVVLSSLIGAYNTTQDPDWKDKHEARLKKIVKEHLPSGSGFDTAVQLDLEKSHAQKLVFHTEFHHMNSYGYYDGWTQHTVTLTPEFGSFDIRVSGRDRNGIKDYIADCFVEALKTLVKEF